MENKNESIHFNNIKNGNKLTIDGKEYVKVKLQFVETLDYDSSKTIENLETETKFLNEKIKILTGNLSSAEKKISSLQIFNTNLINGERTETARLKSEIEKLMTLNDNYFRTIKELESKVESQSQHIVLLDNYKQKLKLKYKERFQDLAKLKLIIHNQRVSLKTMNLSHVGNKKKLKDRIVELKTEINSLKNKLLEKESINEKLLNN